MPHFCCLAYWRIAIWLVERVESMTHFSILFVLVRYPAPFRFVQIRDSIQDIIIYLIFLEISLMEDSVILIQSPICQMKIVPSFPAEMVITTSEVLSWLLLFWKMLTIFVKIQKQLIIMTLTNQPSIISCVIGDQLGTWFCIAKILPMLFPVMVRLLKRYLIFYSLIQMVGSLLSWTNQQVWKTLIEWKGSGRPNKTF